MLRRLRFYGRGDLLGGRCFASLLREVRGGVVSGHPVVVLIRALSRRLFLVGVSVGRARIVRVYLRRRLEEDAGLEVRGLQPVERGGTQLANQVVEGEVRGQVLGARRRRRR